MPGRSAAPQISDGCVLLSCSRQANDIRVQDLGEPRCCAAAANAAAAATAAAATAATATAAVAEATAGTARSGRKLFNFVQSSQHFACPVVGHRFFSWF